MPHRLDVLAASRSRHARAHSPQSVGQWQLLQLIGQGEWSHVYRSQPKQGGPGAADYAVKILKPEYQNDRLAISLLQREMLVASQVRHVHLTSVLSHHCHESPYYLVSPYLIGASLRAALQQTKQLAVPHALWLARQAAEALDALHVHGWRHADVKPENILIGPNGHVTLLDLGFAERLEDAEGQDVIKGSPAYWSPETCHDELPAGAASDIYSLGVTLFESLTGRCPFVKDDVAAMANAHLEDAIPNPRALAPHVGPRVVRLMEAMLAKQPVDRPTAKQLIDQLVELEIETLPERISA